MKYSLGISNFLEETSNLSHSVVFLYFFSFITFIIEVQNRIVVSQEIPGVTGKFGLRVQNEAGQRLTEFCQENAQVIANTFLQQHKRRLYTWTSPDCQYWNQINYIFCSRKWKSSIQSAKTRPGADCGSDHELLISKFRLKLKKIGKTTRPFMYDLSLIPNDYRVEVTNRFNGLDVIECLKNYGLRFLTLHRRWWSKPHPRKRNAKSPIVVWRVLTNSWDKSFESHQHTIINV